MNKTKDYHAVSLSGGKDLSLIHISGKGGCTSTSLTPKYRNASSVDTTRRYGC